MFCRAAILSLGLACTALAETAPTRPPTTAAPAPAGEPAPESDALFKLGQSLFDQFAPSEIKTRYEFPTKEQWDAFAAKLQHALDGDSYEELAACEPEARAALAALRAIPGYEDCADWLEARLDLIAAARQIVQPAPPPPAVPPPAPRVDLPQYDLWVQRLRASPVPARAAPLLPVLLVQFGDEGVPRELVWLAEVESAFNPNARSPAGARGLFQLMPETAKGLGLSVWLPDERTDPKKSAGAAARLLAKLYVRFGDWPLALAAYNAGEGRVSRALAARQGRTFADIAPALSVETRLYVPKVCATVSLRTGVGPGQIAAPSK